MKDVEQLVAAISTVAGGGLVERLLHVVRHLLEKRLRREWIDSDQLRRVLDAHGERDEMLLHAIVKLALDPRRSSSAARTIRSRDARSDATSRRS